jgi:polar amino acid transport system ATP-binding protein
MTTRSATVLRESNQANTAICMSAINKYYGSVHVIKDFSLTIPAGQRIAIIGPSGSGKTSILRLLMALDRPDSGTIEIEGELFGLRKTLDGFTLDRGREFRRIRGKIGMVFQSFNLFPHMTALENVIDAPIHVLGLSKQAAKERGLSLLNRVGLVQKANSFPRELSGGQQQRVAIARALAMEPHIMLFDEVTSALDPELVGEVLEVIRQLTSDRSKTLVLVTHEMSFARDVSDRVVFMDGGRIVEDSNPESIFSQPKCERTRLFLRAVIERRPLESS